MIEKMFYVYTPELELITSYTSEDDAREHAVSAAMDQEWPIAVMLRVPVADFPELRAVAIYDESGRCIWENDAYMPELVEV